MDQKIERKNEKGVMICRLRFGKIYVQHAVPVRSLNSWNPVIEFFQTDVKIFCRKKWSPFRLTIFVFERRKKSAVFYFFSVASTPSVLTLCTMGSSMLLSCI